MTETLIVNLRRIGDIYSCSHLISSMKRNDPNEKISILVYKEFEKAARSLSHVENVFTLDRKAISTIMLNELFSDGFAIELMQKQFETLAKTGWNKIVNFSNDPTGTHLTSYLKEECGAKVLGTNINNGKGIEYNNAWGWVFNDYLTSNKNSPLSFLDCYTKMAEIPVSSMGNKIRTIKKHDDNAYKNIHLVRESIGSDGTDIKIIGIQLFSSTEDKSFSENYSIELINTLLSTKNYCPVIFYGPFKREQEFIKQINSHFNNAIVTAEADLLALPSLVGQMDAVVTPDTAIKHLADCMDIPVVEVAFGSAPLFKQSTIRENNILITPSEPKQSVPSSDIKKGLDVLFAFCSSGEANFSSESSVYRVEKDELGTTFTPISGKFNWQRELYRFSARSYLAQNVAGISYDMDAVYSFKPRQKEFMHWIDKERKVLTSVTKNLLNVLRLTLKGTSLPNFGRSFLNGLELLLTFCDSESLAAIPVIELRASLESLESQQMTANIGQVEELLYKMKGRLQGVQSILKEVENKVTFTRVKERQAPRIDAV